MDVNLEHILVSAKYRQAPLTPETAGYIALAIADSLLHAPSRPGPRHVVLSSEGIVRVEHAPSSTSDEDASRAVRVLLGYMLSVASGSSPALTACAHHRAPTTVVHLIKELESSLIPVNREAAKRALARLAKGAARASLPPGARFVAPPTTKAPRPKSPESLPDDAAPTQDDTDVAVATNPSANVEQHAKHRSDEPEQANLTDPQPQPSFDDIATTEPVDVPPTQVGDHTADEPVSRRDSTTAKHAPTSQPPATTKTSTVSPDEHDPADLDDDGLLTYEPPEVADDDSALDLLTASPPEVAPSTTGNETPVDDEELSLESPTANERDDASDAESSDDEGPITPPPSIRDSVTDDSTKAPTPTDSKSSQHDSPSAESTTGRPDRVQELVGQMPAWQARSTKEVSREVKQMLGLPPTPPPADVQEREPKKSQELESTTESEQLDPNEESERPAMSETKRRKLSLGISFVLLVLALAVLITVYTMYPQLLMSR